MQARLPIGAMNLQFAAGELASRGIVTGSKVIFRQLREVGMLNSSRASRQALAMDWLYEQHGCWDRGYGEYDYVRVFITRSGLAELERRLKAAMPVIRAQEPINLGMNHQPLGF